MSHLPYPLNPSQMPPVNPEGTNQPYNPTAPPMFPEESGGYQGGGRPTPGYSPYPPMNSQFAAPPYQPQNQPGQQPQAQNQLYPSESQQSTPFLPPNPSYQQQQQASMYPPIPGAAYPNPDSVYCPPPAQPYVPPQSDLPYPPTSGAGASQFGQGQFYPQPEFQPTAATSVNYNEGPGKKLLSKSGMLNKALNTGGPWEDPVRGQQEGQD